MTIHITLMDADENLESHVIRDHYATIADRDDFVSHARAYAQAKNPKWIMLEAKWENWEYFITRHTHVDEPIIEQVH